MNLELEAIVIEIETELTFWLFYFVVQTNRCHHFYFPWLKEKVNRAIKK